MSFRLQACKVGLTYSCPVDAELHPFDPGWETGKHKELLELFEKYGAIDKYTIAQEVHESGKHHYHAFVKWTTKVDIKNSRAFDLHGVHPNIIKSPGKGFEAYVTKDKNYETNYFEMDAYAQASEMSDPEEACEFLWKKRPRDMCLNGDRVLANLMRKRQKMDPLKDPDSFKMPLQTDLSKAIILVLSLIHI